MIIRSHGSDFAYRMAEFGNESDIPAPGVSYLPGLPLTEETAFGLPAALQAIRKPSVTIAALDLAVFQGEGASKQRVNNAQARLLDDPTIEMSSFDWMSDMNSAVEGHGNAFALKVRDSRQRLVALEPIHPMFVQVRRVDGAKVFDIHYQGRTRQSLGSEDVFHLRGFSVGTGVAAPSPVWTHRHPLGVALAQETFVGDYFRNDATPGVLLKFPADVSLEKGREWRDEFDGRHTGAGRHRRTAAVGAGADVVPMPVSLQDAQFIQSRGYSVEEIARIFDWPAWALDHTEENETSATVEQRTSELLALYLMPRLERWTRAFKADRDIFGGTASYPEFVTDRFVKVDAATLAEVEHKGVQSGTLLRDEVRADHGRPPLPGGVGSIPLLTPVGAGANPEPMPEPEE